MSAVLERSARVSKPISRREEARRAALEEARSALAISRGNHRTADDVFFDVGVLSSKLSRIVAILETSEPFASAWFGSDAKTLADQLRDDAEREYALHLKGREWTR